MFYVDLFIKESSVILKNVQKDARIQTDFSIFTEQGVVKNIWKNRYGKYFSKHNPYSWLTERQFVSIVKQVSKNYNTKHKTFDMIEKETELMRVVNKFQREYETNIFLSVNVGNIAKAKKVT